MEYIVKTRLLASLLLLSGTTAFGNPAIASDELAGALIGAGAGAIIGNSIDRHDGAVVGGILGAVLGAAIADDHDRRVVHAYPGPYPHPYPGPHARPFRGPPPVVVYEAPHRYMPPPHVQSRPMPYGWRHDHDDYRDGRWDRDHDRGREGRGGGWDRDDRPGNDGRDGRHGR
jgi:hypothetical protein